MDKIPISSYNTIYGIQKTESLRIQMRLPHSHGNEVPAKDIQRGNFCVF